VLLGATMSGMSVFTSAWVLTPLSIAVYLAGWIGCATWWTRAQLRQWVRTNPGVSRERIAERRQMEARQETAFALAWFIMIWIWLAVVAAERVPPLVARWSRHPLEQKDLREIEEAR
jgi:hypothetical protein